MEITDQIGRRIVLPTTPVQRIVSLVPSQTELLYYLGLENNVVGVTKFCELPNNLKVKPKVVGGTKKLRSQELLELEPDLVIGNKEENDKHQIAALEQAGIPIWISDIVTIEQALGMVEAIGLMTGASNEANKLAKEIKRNVMLLLGLKEGVKPRRIAYLIWKEPIMLVGTKTFINTMVELEGYQNCVRSARYPIMTIEALQDLEPDEVWLSSEPFPFQEKHLFFFMESLPKTTVRLVDGKKYSWYGSTLLESTEAMLRGRKNQ